MTDMILPEGWVEVRLPQVANISTGKVDANHAVKNGKYAFYTCAIEPLKSDTYSFEGELLILPGNGANVGHVKFYNGRLEAYQRTYIIYNINIIAKFLFWSLKERWKQLTIEKQYGSATNYIKIGNFNNYVFFMPPIAEQEEIAQRVDRAIGHVDELKSRLETLLTTLKTFRQSVLNAAVTGKLTENWRGKKDLHIKKELFLLKKLITDIRYGTSKKCSVDMGNTPVLRIPNIGNYGKFILNDLKYANFGKEEINKLSLQKDDILLIRSNGSVELVGKPALVTGLEEGYLFAGYLIRIRPDHLQICSKFLLIYLQSLGIRNTIETISRSTSGVNNINAKELSSLEISLPSLEEQEEIVKRVEAYFALADQIEKQVQSALDKVNLLTQSILAKAFRGELTKEWRQKNPELISGENSAEALLKRIKAEKEALEKSSKKTPRSKVKIL